MFPTRDTKVCVVGAGSSGLTAAKNLMEEGFEVDVFEREDDVGGNWNFMKPNSRVYESTRLISSKPFTEYPDFPFPDRYPDYPNHEQVLEYFRSYVRHFDLARVISFETSVERIEPFEGGKGWDVTIRRRDGVEETHRYGACVIANGHNWHPKVPSYPGNFDGEVIHSAQYKSAAVLRNKRVLVVGGGNTGCDVAVEAADSAARCVHSTRRGYWYAGRYTLGRPSDQVSDIFYGSRMPMRIVQIAFETILRRDMATAERRGLRRPDHRILETHPIVNGEIVPYIAEGRIVPKPDIARFDGYRVTFTDGTSEEIDLIVYCTGYLIRFPFLDHSLLNWRSGRPQLFKNVFHPQFDNLFVIGLIQPDSGQFKLVHWQSVAAARFLGAQIDNPAAADRFRAERDMHLGEHLGASVHYKDSSRHFVEINHMEYLRGLEDLIHLVETA